MIDTADDDVQATNSIILDSQIVRDLLQASCQLFIVVQIEFPPSFVKLKFLEK